MIWFINYTVAKFSNIVVKSFIMVSTRHCLQTVNYYNRCRLDEIKLSFMMNNFYFSLFFELDCKRKIPSQQHCSYLSTSCCLLRCAAQLFEHGMRKSTFFFHFILFCCCNFLPFVQAFKIVFYFSLVSCVCLTLKYSIFMLRAHFGSKMILTNK